MGKGEIHPAIQVRKRLFDKDVMRSVQAVAIGSAICHRLGKDGVCWMSLDLLAKMVNLDKRSVRRYFHELCDGPAPLFIKRQGGVVRGRRVRVLVFEYIRNPARYAAERDEIRRAHPDNGDTGVPPQPAGTVLGDTDDPSAGLNRAEERGAGTPPTPARGRRCPPRQDTGAPQNKLREQIPELGEKSLRRQSKPTDAAGSDSDGDLSQNERWVGGVDAGKASPGNHSPSHSGYPSGLLQATEREAQRQRYREFAETIRDRLEEKIDDDSGS